MSAVKGQKNSRENYEPQIVDAWELHVSEYDLEKLEPGSWPLVMRDLADAVESLLAALERARSLAVRLEQENAALTVGAARRVL